MGVWVVSRSQAAVFSVEESTISIHRECKTSLLKCEAYWVVKYEFGAQEQTIITMLMAIAGKYAVKLTWKLE